MKPLQVGFLVIGAALAGGLAVKMTQPPTYHAVSPPVSPTPASAPPQAAATPPPVAPVPAPEPIASAPPVVYEKPKAAPPPAPEKPKTLPKVVVKSAPARPHPPVEVAKAELPPKPPVPYQAAPEPTPTPSATPSQIPPAPDPGPEPPSAPPPPPVALQVTLHQGMQIAVRLDQALSSDHVSPGDTFQGSLAEPVVKDGYIIAERGARVSGRVVDSRKAGRLSGNSDIQLALASFQTADGQKIAISTEPWVKEGVSSKGEDVAKIGGGAALGAIIGAIAGGGKGAALGAGVGGAAGTGAAAATRGKPVTIPSETVIRFRLANRVTITERPL